MAAAAAKAAQLAARFGVSMTPAPAVVSSLTGGAIPPPPPAPMPGQPHCMFHSCGQEWHDVQSFPSVPFLCGVPQSLCACCTLLCTVICPCPLRAAPASVSIGSAKAAPLRLDLQGRPVDEFGNLLGKSIQASIGVSVLAAGMCAVVSVFVCVPRKYTSAQVSTCQSAHVRSLPVELVLTKWVQRLRLTGLKSDLIGPDALGTQGCALSVFAATMHPLFVTRADPMLHPCSLCPLSKSTS